MQLTPNESGTSNLEQNMGGAVEVRSKIAEELTDDELETMLAERKAEKARQAAAHEAKVAEDAAKAVTLAEQIKSGNIGGPAEKSADVVEARNKNEARGAAYTQFNKMTDAFRGEAEMALAEGNMQGFQEAYIKMTENKIAELQFRIQGTDEDINDGSYQELQAHRPGDSVEKIRGIYEYQKKNLAEQVEQLRSGSIELVKSNPQTIIMREGYDEKRDKVDVLKVLLKEAHSFWMAAKRDGREMSVIYPNATAKVEGAVAAALRYKDPKVMAFLKYTFDDPLGMPHTYVVLSPELQQQIHDLKV